MSSEKSSSFKPDASAEVRPVDKPPVRGPLRDLLSVFGVLVGALLLAFVLISFVFQSYQVSGPSMQTTLENEDHLIVWKLPKTIATLTGRHYLPHRGDVIILNEADASSKSGRTQLVKRVVALPGERIVIHDGSVTVYGHDNPAGFDPDKTLPYGVVIKNTPGDEDVTLGKNQVYVLGDHRDNSKDSRFFGPVESDQIVGKLAARVLPLNTFKLF